VAAFDGVFLADFGLDFGYEAITFLLDCALSECTTI
jgi:hypothetical protein